MKELQKVKWKNFAYLSFVLSIIFGIMLLTFIGLGQRGGDRYWDNLTLAIPGTLFFMFGVIAFPISVTAIIERERSIPLYILTVFSGLFTIYAFTELLFTH